MTATPKQILDVLLSCKEKPKFPSQVEVSEHNLFDPIHQQKKQQLFEELHSRGLLQHVRDPKGRRTPQGYAVTPAGLAEISLLQKHPAIAGAGKAADPTAKNRGSFQ